MCRTVCVLTGGASFPRQLFFPSSLKPILPNPYPPVIPHPALATFVNFFTTSALSALPPPPVCVRKTENKRKSANSLTSEIVNCELWRLNPPPTLAPFHPPPPFSPPNSQEHFSRHPPLLFPFSLVPRARNYKNFLDRQRM